MTHTIKIKYEKFLEIYAALRNVDISTEDKFHYAVIDLVERFKSIYSDYNYKVYKINLRFAHEDPISKIVTKPFQFSKENYQQREKTLRLLLQKKVKIPVHQIPITDELRKRLNPFIIHILNRVVFEPSKK